jgi:LemA protein
MGAIILLLIVVVSVATIILYSSYVKVVKSGNAVREAKSSIDVQFRKRYDLLPNILTIAQRFMTHEKEIFTKITELRSQAINAPAGSQEAFECNKKLDSVLGQLKVSMENYPILKSDATMTQAMKTYNEVEEHIAAARRFYNSAITQLRNYVMIFPTSLFKGYVQEEMQNSYYEIEDKNMTKAVNAADYLK